MASEPTGAEDPSTPAGTRGLLAGAACALFVVVAVTLEILAGARAGSPAPAWADGLVPLTWPPAARTLWWLAVGAAAAGYRLSLAAAGLRPRRWVTVLTVAPFLAFAAGVSVGASWATWH